MSKFRSGIAVWTLLSSVFVFVFSQVAIGGGKELYTQHCSTCHHAKRIGYSAPPLLPETLEKIPQAKLEGIIQKGLPNTLMPAFGTLSASEVTEIATFVKSKGQTSWTAQDISRSRALSKDPAKKLDVQNLENLTTVVERGKSQVWVMEGQKVLDQFPFSDIHGGLKYSRDNRQFFIPGRDGYVGRYDIDRGYFGKTRACISLRNITVSNNLKYVLVSCLLPQQLVVLNAKDLSLVKTQKVEGKVSAVYTLVNEDIAVFTYRDKPQIGYYNFSKLNLKLKDLPEAIEDFFIDPLDQYLVGTARGGSKLSVVDLANQKVIFEYSMGGMPHLSSATYWYDRGEFYFATFHIQSNYISVWKMYPFSFIKKIEVGGNGFFVRTHPKVNQLWIDNGSDEVVLVDKRTLEVSKIKPFPTKKFTHTEFSADGQIAYLSIYEKDGALLLYDTATLKEIKRFSASFPVGKYNVVNKERPYAAPLLGESVFMGKCWGCHHQEEVAFGPAFVDVAAKRTKEMIRTHLDDPKLNAKNLGYKNPTMPKIPLTEAEKEFVSQYIVSLKPKKVILKEITLYNMAEHSLTHPERVVKDCAGYKQWKNLGFSAFSEADKLEEQKYAKVCQ